MRNRILMVSDAENADSHQSLSTEIAEGMLCGKKAWLGI